MVGVGGSVDGTEELVPGCTRARFACLLACLELLLPEARAGVVEEAFICRLHEPKKKKKCM